MKNTVITASAFALILLSGCVETSDTANEASIPSTATETPVKEETPEKRKLSVLVNDTVPLTMYYNYDDVSCYSKSALENATESAPQITIRDEADAIIATTEATEFGGTLTDDGCKVQTIVHDVPVSKFYQVEIEAEGQSFKTTIEEDDDPNLTAEFNL